MTQPSTSAAPVQLPLDDPSATALIPPPVAPTPVPGAQGEPTGVLQWPSMPAPAAAPIGAPIGAPTGDPGQSAPQLISCPECGTSAMVTLTRRDAVDFCAKCDFPLFWVPTRIELGAGSLAGESLRRLPGTVGRATVASLACPHCAEPNALTAQTCVRCGLPMHVVEEAPAPVMWQPPAPEPVVVPEKGTPWWVWALIGLGIAAGVAVLTLLLLNYYN